MYAKYDTLFNDATVVTTSAVIVTMYTTTATEDVMMLLLLLLMMIDDDSSSKMRRKKLTCNTSVEWYLRNLPGNVFTLSLKTIRENTK